MIKILKKVWVVFVLLFLLFPLTFADGGTSQAQTNVHYIKNTVMLTAQGEVNVSLIMSCEFSKSQTVLEREAFKTQLISQLNVDLANKKAKILSFYMKEGIEEYNPQTQIVFGDNGQAVKGKDYVGYNIKYASLDVYKYYNNLICSYKKGFLFDKSKQILDNPFNDVNEEDGVYVTEADRYKKMFIEAGKVVGMEDYVSQYNPYYYNDYVTPSRRTKSNAISVMKDTENNYHHIWVSDSQTLTTDDEMKVTLNVIHAGWWYLLGTAIPLGIMTIVIIAVKIMGKFKNNVEKTDKSTGDENEREEYS